LFNVRVKSKNLKHKKNGQNFFRPSLAIAAFLVLK